MRVKSLVVAGIAVAGLGAIAYAAAPSRSAAQVSRAVQIRSAYNPFTLTRVTVAQQAIVPQSHGGRHVRPPHRPPPRSHFRPPGRGPWFEPPGPPPNTGGPGGAGPGGRGPD